MLMPVAKQFRIGACFMLVGMIGLATDAQEAATVSSRASVGKGLPRSLDNPQAFARTFSLPTDWTSHPLAPAVKFALERYHYVRDHVKDFTCILVKRERIDGRLRDYEFLQTKVRTRQFTSEGKLLPYSVFIKFLGPAKYRGRLVLYVAGENDNQILVRNGGERFDYVTVRLSPKSEAAKRESRHPITEMGLDNISSRLIEQALVDIRNDPKGENTRVTFLKNSKVNNRICTQIRVVHPQRGTGMTFHQANIFIDDELKVPVRLAAYDWPTLPDGEPILLEEYTYTELKLNVGLKAADFATSLVEWRDEPPSSGR